MALAVGVVVFGAAMVGFGLVGTAAEAGQVAVVSASRTLLPGEVLQANASDLSRSGSEVHLGPAALADAFPESAFRALQGAVALVRIPAGAMILRQDVSLGGSSQLRQVSLTLSSIPPGLTPGNRVDLLSVWGVETGTAAPGASLCGTPASVGCVAPLAQSVEVLAVDQADHSLTIEVPPAEVAPWLLLAATQPIWAVLAGPSVCAGAEQAISDPAAALQAIQNPYPTSNCAPGGGQQASTVP